MQEDTMAQPPEQPNPSGPRRFAESWTERLTALASNRASYVNSMKPTEWTQVLLKHDVVARDKMLDNVIRMQKGWGLISFEIQWATPDELQSYWANQLRPHLTVAFPSTTFKLNETRRTDVLVRYWLPTSNGLLSGTLGQPFIKVDWDQYCSNLLKSLEDTKEIKTKLITEDWLMGQEMRIRQSMLNACKNGKFEGSLFVGTDVNMYFTQILQPHLCKVLPTTTFELKQDSSPPTEIAWRMLTVSCAAENAASSM